jgi:SprT protein
MDQSLAFQNILKKYLPKEFVVYVSDLIIHSNVKFKIVAPRSTKLGDFRASSKNDGKPQITINGDLNPYAFLITTLHELAHLNTFHCYGAGVNPHGKEWKKEFTALLEPILNVSTLPFDIKNTLTKSIKNPKASSCSDIHLTRVLKKYDQAKNTQTLEELDENAIFSINKKVFTKGKLRRTRYLCNELVTGKSYLIHALAEVKKKK